MNFSRMTAAVAAALVMSFVATNASAESYIRPLPQHPITVGATTLGDIRPVVTVPLVAQTHDNILNLQVVKRSLKTQKRSRHFS